MRSEILLVRIENYFKDLRKNIDHLAEIVKSEMEHDDLEKQILKEIKQIKKGLKK